MEAYQTKRLPPSPDEVAPDGSEVRVLLRLRGGSMAHFHLSPGKTSRAIRHRTVEEIWYCLSGRGEMWRSREGREEIVVMEPGVCLTIPVGTCFQFRSLGPEPLSAVAVTMPPWPGDAEAETVPGPWRASVAQPGRDFHSSDGEAGHLSW